MNKIVHYTINRINDTINRLQRVESYNKSINKYTWVKVANEIEPDALYGLKYFRGLLCVDLHLTDRLFSSSSHFVFSSIMPKNRI